MDLYHTIWDAGLKLIEIRMHSKKELHDKLSSKFPNGEAHIIKVIEEMERVFLLDDKRFAQQYLAALIQKNVGRLKIIHEARKRGLSDALTEAILLELDWSEKNAAQKAIQEKERVLRSVEERQKKQKLLNFLRNRGFSDRIIYSTLSE